MIFLFLLIGLLLSISGYAAGIGQDAGYYISRKEDDVNFTNPAYYVHRFEFLGKQGMIDDTWTNIRICCQTIRGWEKCNTDISRMMANESRKSLRVLVERLQYIKAEVV